MPGSAYSFKLIKLCALRTSRVSFFKQAPVLALPTLSVFAENTTFRRNMQFLTLCLIICNILVLHVQRVGFTLWEMQTTLKRWRKLLCGVRWQPHSTANLEDPESWKCLTHRRYHHAHLHIYIYAMGVYEYVITIQSGLAPGIAFLGLPTFLAHHLLPFPTPDSSQCPRLGKEGNYMATICQRC